MKSGGAMIGNQLWRRGPLWLTKVDEWPDDKTTLPASESKAEARATREVFKAAIELNDDPEQIFAEFPLNKVVRIYAYISRFCITVELK